ncbi:cell division protein FtsL [Coxiella endosymbiont of Amblyomma nuttalli]|uniref:cell division protein FtsL n=1 Tax=Coxiella endosymbiont of Amblyomma nuttalli TaxID=2749996 RepID=UPI001BAC3A1B|nr:cell division protein FtsL [Coxiella endosymbiont of Amblyomma nuttalli]QTS83749.1 Cell division protein FtsL [Coxiella endosymbiont of Amblyomma nuttalli]
MNAVTRVIVKQNIETRNRIFYVTRCRILIISLVVDLLCSAFGVIYFKDLNRRLFIRYETLQHEKMEELIEWGRLLLEQSTWSTQSRIQQIAQQKLGMEVPGAKEIILINENNAAIIK